MAEVSRSVPKVGSRVHQTDHPRRFSLENETRHGDGIEAHVQQTAATDGGLVAHVLRRHVVVREETGHRPQLPDAPLAHQVARPQPARVRLHHHRLLHQPAGTVAGRDQLARLRCVERDGLFAQARVFPPPARGWTKARADDWATGCRWRPPRGHPAVPRTSRRPGGYPPPAPQPGPSRLFARPGPLRARPWCPEGPGSPARPRSWPRPARPSESRSPAGRSASAQKAVDELGVAFVGVGLGHQAARPVRATFRPGAASAWGTASKDAAVVTPSHRHICWGGCPTAAVR